MLSGPQTQPHMLADPVGWVQRPVRRLSRWWQVWHLRRPMASMVTRGWWSAPRVWVRSTTPTRRPRPGDSGEISHIGDVAVQVSTVNEGAALVFSQQSKHWEVVGSAVLAGLRHPADHRICHSWVVVVHGEEWVRLRNDLVDALRLSHGSTVAELRAQAKELRTP